MSVPKSCTKRIPWNSTPSRLLEGAERSLLSHGYKGSSVRRIADEAGVNAASINYHFGTKREMFAELFRQRFQPVAQCRGELLKGVEADASVSVAAIVQAYFGTLFRYCESAGQKTASVIWMLLNGEPEVSQLASECMGGEHADLTRRYVRILARAIPGVPEMELEWRLEVMERFALCVIAGPNVGWVARASDPPDAGGTRSPLSVAEGLVGIIQACIQAPHATRLP